VARALGAVLATVRGQSDVLDVLSAGWASADDANRFILAALASFATLVERKVDDPQSYLLAWIALELELADDAERAS
jgi:hypothetical protein